MNVVDDVDDGVRPVRHHLRWIGEQRHQCCLRSLRRS